ncbi:MAG: TonB-dependent receptor, partial [Rikenellaceae bacterium]|nr:TonB-dependent receptor [Rikenellaceae bacterium]
AVTHRADGYSLTLGDSKMAEGRNAREALRYVPGLWIDSNEDIKINGQGGVQVMINDRIVTMSSGELLRYLEGINAEDIKSIDVVRSAGAKYDAAVGGAVLKINLRNRNINGVFGNVSMTYERTDTLDLKYNPSAWINVMHKKLSLSTGFSYSRTNYSEHIDMDTYFRSSGDTLSALYASLNKYRSMTYDIRGVYRFDDRNSIGLDYHLGNYRNTYNNVSDGVIARRELLTRMSSLSPNCRSDNHDLSFNYRRQLDTLGSDLLVVADYHYAATNGRSYTTTADYTPMGSLLDYVYDISNIRNDFYTVRIDINKRLSKKWSLGYGAKYSYSTLSSVYDYYTSVDNHNWSHRLDYSDDYRYREGVAAAYATTSASLGRWNITAGVRVENTDMRPKSLRQSESHHSNYTDVFPSAAVSYAINPQKKHLVALNYRRSISRPGFSMLDPSRVKVDNVTVSVGNPYLQPSYAENVTLNFTLAGSYM